MKLFDFKENKLISCQALPTDFDIARKSFILCKPSDLDGLRDIFSFDETTLKDCQDLDESVRLASFDEYDFISLVYMDRLPEQIALSEINIYFSKNYIVLVMPEICSEKLQNIERSLLAAIESAKTRAAGPQGVYYLLLSRIVEDFSMLLEDMESYIEVLWEDLLSQKASKSDLAKIHLSHRFTYTIRKQLRALSYVSGQIAMNESELLEKGELRFFRNIDSRLRKLYDFAANLYDLSSQLINTYNSNIAMKTNDGVTKLTAITVIFGPLTVITGIYGMNFTTMPELAWRFGYPTALLAMAVVSALTYWIMKKNKWF